MIDKIRDSVKEKEKEKEKEESWLLTPSDMTTQQRTLLISLPEHMIGQEFKPSK